MILGYSKEQIVVEVDDTKLRPVDVPIIEADVSKLRAATGWKKNIDLKETIRQTIEYWRKNIL